MKTNDGYTNMGHAQRAQNARKSGGFENYIVWRMDLIDDAPEPSDVELQEVLSWLISTYPKNGRKVDEN